MTREQTIEKYRLAVLRLLAAVAFVVVFVSRAPAVIRLPDWIGGSVSSLLDRIEDGVESLAIAAAQVFCGYRGDPKLLRAAHRPDVLEPESAPRLLRKIAVLRAILKDLPRYAKRLMRRAARRRAVASMPTLPPVRRSIPPKPAPAPTRIERPPDKETFQNSRGEVSRFMGVLLCAAFGQGSPAPQHA